MVTSQSPNARHQADFRRRRELKQAAVVYAVSTLWDLDTEPTARLFGMSLEQVERLLALVDGEEDLTAAAIERWRESLANRTPNLD